MKKISAEKIFETAKNLIVQANFELPKKVQEKIQHLKNTETEKVARSALEIIAQNANIAPRERLPLCQDTGTAVFFVQIGHAVSLEEPIGETLARATESAYQENYLRDSLVGDPLYERKNTGNNCPPTVKIEMTAGENLEIIFLPKGGGAENKSILTMLRPVDGEEGVIKTVVEAARNAGGSACPPWIVGIGIGGTFDTVAGLAKKAILREIGSIHPEPQYATLEKKLASEIEKLGIGTLGFGGKKTLLALHIETAPTHMASLPVAVNFQCHSARSARAVL